MNEQGNSLKGKSHIWPGLLLLIIGGLLLLRQLGVVFPYWFFSWPLLLVAIGFALGLRQGFKGGGWIIMVFIGGVFLANNLVTGINLRPFSTPIILIALGAYFILRPKNNWGRKGFPYNQNQDETVEPYRDARGFNDGNDYVDAVCIFGNIKKNVVSKDFRGADVVNIMAGSELNLSMADINGKVIVDATCIFGGAKLIIPSTWDVQSEVVAIFGGVEDKRQVSTAADTNKILILRGVCLFGGIEIKSY